MLITTISRLMNVSRWYDFTGMVFEFWRLLYEQSDANNEDDTQSSIVESDFCFSCSRGLVTFYRRKYR